MSKASPTTYRVGSIGEFAAWTKDMLRNSGAGRDVPRKWFDAEATVSRAPTAAAQDFDDRTERRRWLRILVTRARDNARKKGMAFDLTPEFAETLWKDGRCAVTGRSFSLQAFADALVKHPFAPSIDRKLSSGGYTKDNVRLVCVAVNFGMGQWGQEVFLELAHAAVDHEQRAPRVTSAADWEAGYRERIAAAQAVLVGLPPSEQAKQQQRIAGLKRALTLGPDGLRAAAAKAKANRKPARLQAG
jgi:hypothetical protein